MSFFIGLNFKFTVNLCPTLFLKKLQCVNSRFECVNEVSCLVKRGFGGAKKVKIEDAHF